MSLGIIIFIDHQTEPKVAVTGVRKLLDIDRVDGVICDLTPTCQAISPLVRDAKKILLYHAPTVSILESNPYAFKNFLDYEAGCESIARHWKKLGLKKIGHLKLNTEFGELCFKGSQKVFSEQVVFSYNSTDELKTFVTRFKAQNIEGVFQTGYESDYLNYLVAAKTQEFNVLTALPEPLLTKALIDRVAGDLSKGIYTFGYPALSKDFRQHLKEANLYQSEVGVESAAIAYMQIQQMFQATQKCSSNDLDCQILEVEGQAASSISGFNGWKNRIAQYDLVIKNWNGQHLVVIK
jgi:ABC-type branched-subunit amino acid transport system substrate-binding protein